MKNNININQKACIESGLKLDIVDMSILDFIKDFTHSPRCRFKVIDDVVYYEISWRLIVQDLPILGINQRRGIIQRITKLVHADILKRPQTKEDRTFIGFSNNYEKLFFSDENTKELATKTPVHAHAQGEHSGAHGVHAHAQGEHSGAHGVHDGAQVNPPVIEPDTKSGSEGVHDGAHNYIYLYTIINNNTIYNKYKERVIEICEHWNSKKIIVHKDFDEKALKAIIEALKANGLDNILTGINNYTEVIESEFFFSHRWSLKDFLSRKNALSTFLEDGSNWVSYEKWNNKVDIKHAFARSSESVVAHNRRMLKEETS